MPLGTLLHPRLASPRRVVQQIAAGMARPRDPRPMPGWLRPEQQNSCARLLPILQRFRGALLADPVGSGKTWVALAVASLWPDTRPVTVLLPAALQEQWRRAGSSAGVSLMTWSHERLSRGNVPATLRPGLGSTLVIIDESHHYRSPGCRRYRVLAPCLVNRTVLLLSATPAVNRLADLAAQLALGVRDDALAPFGVASIADHLGRPGRASPALGELIVGQAAHGSGRPARLRRKVDPPPGDDDLEGRCRQLEQLALSPREPTRVLLRSLLWRALGSSDAALLDLLRRYRNLLAHAQDARAVGLELDRRSLRCILPPDDDQLIMWSLMPADASLTDLCLDDLPLLDTLLEQARTAQRRRDPRCERLAGMTADGRTTLVFTCARGTVRYLRNHLPGSAWCTGESAGIGGQRMARQAILSWFGPGAPPGGPRVLITTDVLAEGLDLQGAERVIHYDLPWTAVRLDQRDGRAIRRGSRHERVEVIRFNLPAPIRRRLEQLPVLARKRRLPTQAGIEQAALDWTRREEVVARHGGPFGSGPAGYCGVHGEPGLLAGFAIVEVAPDGPRRLASVVASCGPDGAWSEDLARVERRMQAAGSRTRLRLSSEDRIQAISRAAAGLQHYLSTFQQAQWSRPLTTMQTKLIGRLNRLAADAVKARDGARVAALERGIAFARRGHTAGERLWLEQVMELPAREFLRAIDQCPGREPEGALVLGALLGLVVFGGDRPD